MKVKAFILAMLFLFGGSGLSVDIALCCDKISGFAIGLKGHSETEKNGCCERLKPVRKSSCCETATVQTVINPVLAFVKKLNHDLKAAPSKIIFIAEKESPSDIPAVFTNPGAQFDHHYPVPILKRKRVLQI